MLTWICPVYCAAHIMQATTPGSGPVVHKAVLRGGWFRYVTPYLVAEPGTHLGRTGRCSEPG